MVSLWEAKKQKGCGGDGKTCTYRVELVKVFSKFFKTVFEEGSLDFEVYGKLEIFFSKGQKTNKW